MEIYNILSDLVGFKFKAQFNNCGIEFIELSKVVNLISGKVSFLLCTEDKVIRFSDRQQFLIEFTSLIKESLEVLEKEEKELQEQSNSRWANNYEIFYESERIGSEYGKQLKLLEKFKKFTV